MTEKAILITGAAGEVGHALVKHFSDNDTRRVVALDLNDNPGYSPSRVEYIKSNICDKAVFEALNKRYDFEEIFHLASILSTGGEKNPLLAQQVNIDGSLNVLNLAREQGLRLGRPTKVIFPSTIAIYGIKDLATKQAAGTVTESQFLEPITMYGINKLYVENLGRYFEKNFKFLERAENEHSVDFRGVRFPGILSSETVPTGGTSDFGPEMLHFAAQGKSYECFVEAGTTIPFMVMPDAVKALLKLAAAPKEKLSRQIYNVTAFSISAEEISREVKKYFPGFKMSYKPHARRLAICNSWPMDIDDRLARKDWGWAPDYSRERSFAEYLVPAVIKRYSSATDKQACNH